MPACLGKGQDGYRVPDGRVPVHFQMCAHEYLGAVLFQHPRPSDVQSFTVLTGTFLHFFQDLTEPPGGFQITVPGFERKGFLICIHRLSLQYGGVADQNRKSAWLLTGLPCNQDYESP